MCDELYEACCQSEFRWIVVELTLLKEVLHHPFTNGLHLFRPQPPVCMGDYNVNIVAVRFSSPVAVAI